MTLSEIVLALYRIGYSAEIERNEVCDIVKINIQYDYDLLPVATDVEIDGIPQWDEIREQIRAEYYVYGNYADEIANACVVGIK